MILKVSRASSSSSSVIWVEISVVEILACPRAFCVKRRFLVFRKKFAKQLALAVDYPDRND